MTIVDTIAEPTEADLIAAEQDATEALSGDVLTASEYAAILDAEMPVIAPRYDEDYWAEDDNVHDDRYDGTGIPSWSAWA